MVVDEDDDVTAQKNMGRWVGNSVDCRAKSKCSGRVGWVGLMGERE